MRRNFLKSKKFKYGSLATVFTAAFVAFVVIFNIIFTALGDKYMWRVDMTKEQVFTLSEEAKEIMSDITEEVNIYFASEPDVLLTGNYSAFTRFVYTTALQLEEEFPNIHVHCENVEKNPEFFREFYNTTASVIDPNSVILESNGEVRVFAINAFYMYNEPTDISTVWAYNGEKRLISGIMQVTQTETPKVVFTTEHGEDINNALSIASVFAENGYEVETLDLATEEVSPDCRVMVIYNPMYDFIGAEAEDKAKNEIEKLDKFLDNYGCLIVLCDPEYVGNLTNLNEFLEEWGISFMANTTVRDHGNSMSVDGYSIITEYQPNTMGGSIYADLNTLST
ncbi:MAG: GldG family protein, partial [Oscillospiraceae bacterium]|nr:GldG family protein [Oscillospiraceae bacterium]